MEPKEQTPKKIDRKYFIATLILASGAAFFGGQYYSDWYWERALNRAENPAEYLLESNALLEVLNHLRVIGEHCKDYFESLEKEEILTKLNHKLKVQEISRENIFNQVNWLEQSIQEDFEKGRLINAGDWLLSETEAKLAVVCWTDGKNSA